MGLLVVCLSISVGHSQSVFAAPSVLVDIAPAHSLVAMVMGDIGTPKLLLSSSTNPHNVALKPSDAAQIANAELIIFTSSTLTPWLNKALRSLAPNSPTFELVTAKGTNLLPLRNDHLFAHTDHKGHAEHKHSEPGNNSESNGKIFDPHAWLDPTNALVWLDDIALQLSVLDGENAETYQQNAQNAKQKIEDMAIQVKAELNGLEAIPYLVFHDSYQYFETTFNLQPKGSINLGDGSQPSIGQIRKLQGAIKSSTAQCVFTEPQYSDRLVNTVVGNAKTNVGKLDPLGFELETGQSLYVNLLKKLSSSLKACLIVK